MPPVTARPDRAVDVILRDGTTLRLRQPQPPDGDALLSFFSELSPESLHSRFHGGTRIARSLVEHLLSQSEDRDALVAIVGVGAARRRGRIGGELCRHLLAADFADATYPVDRSGGPVAGVAASRSLADIPVPVDLAVSCLPSGQVLDAAGAAIAAGVRALCV